MIPFFPISSNGNILFVVAFTVIFIRVGTVKLIM